MPSLTGALVRTPPEVFLLCFGQFSLFCSMPLNSSELSHSVAQSSEDIEDVVLLQTQRRRNPKGNMNRTGALNVHPHSLKRGQ